MKLRVATYNLLAGGSAKRAQHWSIPHWSRATSK
jgi:hypothetical protein